ncbi:hypothetical protein K1719_032190 [Acacia pycnantha]|nr:hypothetical protein K1719_032190 [Acacia pycnantha]
MIDHKGVKSRCWSFCFKKILKSKCKQDKEGQWREGFRTSKKVMSCLDARENDKGDVVVTIGDRYDAREQTKETEVRNLGKSVELASQYYKDGADEISFLNITVSGTSLLETCLCCRYCNIQERITWGAWLFKMQLTLPESIRRGNGHAVQFHPEKSGDVGLSVLRRFLNPNANRNKDITGFGDFLLVTCLCCRFRDIHQKMFLYPEQLLVEFEILQILMAVYAAEEYHLRTGVTTGKSSLEQRYLECIVIGRRRVAIIEEAELARGW